MGAKTRQRFGLKWILKGIVLSALLGAARSEGASITISVLDALSFGKLAAGSGGTVTVSPTGTRTRSGGVALLSSSTGSRARFHVTGDPNTAYIISLPADNDSSLSSGGSSMNLSQFTSGSLLSSSFDGTGAMDLTVGATLVVDASKQPGDYSGTYSIIVNYQ